MRSSTRRLAPRPASVPLSATGWLSPNPLVAILTGWFDTFNRWAQDLLNNLGINVSSDI